MVFNRLIQVFGSLHRGAKGAAMIHSVCPNHGRKPDMIFTQRSTFISWCREDTARAPRGFVPVTIMKVDS
ncbi:hypothetical protein B2D07_06655 [Desulfococcus multivorans]|nr:hypothetical protein B2D07_06655 [Desulfococcus multivorans]